MSIVQNIVKRHKEKAQMSQTPPLVCCAPRFSEAHLLQLAWNDRISSFCLFRRPFLTVHVQVHAILVCLLTALYCGSSFSAARFLSFSSRDDISLLSNFSFPTYVQVVSTCWDKNRITGEKFLVLTARKFHLLHWFTFWAQVHTTQNDRTLKGCNFLQTSFSSSTITIWQHRCIQQEMLKQGQDKCRDDFFLHTHLSTSKPREECTSPEVSVKLSVVNHASKEQNRQEIC